MKCCKVLVFFLFFFLWQNKLLFSFLPTTDTHSPVPFSSFCSPPSPASSSLCLSASTGESSQELGPPPSVDEAANTLMTRLGFLLGDKLSEGPAGTQYSMEEPEARQVPEICFFLTILSDLHFFPDRVHHVMHAV